MDQRDHDTSNVLASNAQTTKYALWIPLSHTLSETSSYARARFQKLARRVETVCTPPPVRWTDDTSEEHTGGPQPTLSIWESAAKTARPCASASVWMNETPSHNFGCVGK